MNYYTSSDKCFKPSERLVSFLENWKQYKEDKEDLEKKKNEGTDIEKQEEELRKRYAQLRSEKTKIMNQFVFPAMANITKFVELTSMDIMREDFAEELYNLLLESNKQSSNGWSVFQRFIHDAARPIPNPKIEEGKTAFSLTDYRIKLLAIMQETIWTIVVDLAEKKYLHHPGIAEIFNQDIARATNLIRLMTSEANIVEHKSPLEKRRPVLF